MKPRTSSTLTHLSTKDLHARFLAAFGKPTTSRNRPWLLKRLQAVAVPAVKGKAAPAPKAAASATPTSGRSSVTARNAGLSPGTDLRRVWKDKEVVVTVTDAGFLLNGTTYQSLSAAATAITGTNWNGHVFFGLKKRAPKRQVAQ